MKKRRVEVNEKMQSGYVYFCTEPAGRNFDPDFKPELTPQEMLELGVFGGKYMTDCKAEFPASWFRRAKLSSQRHDQLFWCKRIGAAVGLAQEGLDLSRGSARLVSMVLPLLHGASLSR